MSTRAAASIVQTSVEPGGLLGVDAQVAVVGTGTTPVSLGGINPENPQPGIQAGVAAQIAVLYPEVQPPIEPSEVLILGTIFAPKTFDDQGALIATNRLTAGGGYRQASHNLCDPCSWWQESTHSPHTATTGSLNLEYTLTGDAPVIDLRHGRYTFEDGITDATVAPNGNIMTDLVPTVFLDGVALDHSHEDAGDSDPDRYTIDYPTGKIVFSVARDPGVVVTISCRRSATSGFAWVAKSGHKITLIDAEFDFTENLNLISPLILMGFGSHSAPPELGGTGGAVVPVEVKVYKSMRDIVAMGREVMPSLPAGVGGAGGFPAAFRTIRWEYVRSDILHSTPGWEDTHGEPTKGTLNKLQISLHGDVPLGGSSCTFTLYGAQDPE